MFRDASTTRRKPIDPAGLERIALRYVERYATTRAKLGAYLRRKIAERGWDGGDAPPPIDGLVDRFVALGYIDDRGFATARAASLSRRGYGDGRIRLALRAAGIAEEEAEAVREEARETARDAALAFARRKRIGPFAEQPPDRERRQKALAALLRAGHPMEVAQEIMGLPPQ